MASLGARVPRLIPGVDLTKLPLSPLEGFVLSRVDGMASLSVLSDLTNLDEEQVTGIVARLIDLGAVEWVRESVSLPRATGRVATRTPAAPYAPPMPGEVREPAARVNVPRPIRAARPIRASASSGEGVYKDRPSGEEHVEPSRRSVFPPAAPRASHTGTRSPVGEVEEFEELGTADTLTPPAGDGLQGDWLGDGLEFAPLAPPAAPPASTPPPPEPPPASARPSRPPPASPSAPSEPPPRPASARPPEPPPRPASAPPPQATPAPEAASAPPSPSGGEAPEGEVELDPERRRRIDDLYVALDLLDHYQVLGVPRDAKRDAIRSAYFALSKVFHPDTMFRRRLGPYKAKMEAIFKRLTEAYEVLGKSRARQEYDRYLGLQDRTRRLESALDPEVAAEAQRELGLAAAQLEAELAFDLGPPAPEPTKAAPATSEAQAPAPTSSQTRPMSEAAKARARELMAKKLRGAARASEATRRTKVDATERLPSEPPPAAPVDKAQVLKSLAGSLKDSASHTGGVDQIQRHVLTAKRAEREGDLAEASRALRLALAMAPERADLRAEHARVNGLLASSLATSYEEQALYESRHGKWGAAALSWAKVFEGRPDDARAARLAAEALVEAKGDLHKAKELAQKAAELAPDDVSNLRALGRVYIAAGLALNARRVLQRAAALDPSDEMVENLLRDLNR